MHIKETSIDSPSLSFKAQYHAIADLKTGYIASLLRHEFSTIMGRCLSIFISFYTKTNYCFSHSLLLLFIGNKEQPSAIAGWLKYWLSSPFLASGIFDKGTGQASSEGVL